MQFKNYINTKLPFFVALSFAFVLASCGSYQYVGYDSDGIYSENDVVYTEAETTTESSDNSYYKNYFTEKANQYNDIPDDERVIFTDIDSYEGDYSDENLEDESQYGYSGWGQANDNITINVYDNSWASPYWNGGFGFGYNWYRPWGWNYGFGWNNWGWNSGFGWGGWNNWGYNYGWCPPFYNYGYGYNPYFHGNYYNHYGIAYNSGRRGSNLAYSNRNSVTRRNTSNITRRNTSTVTRGRSNTVRNNSTTRRNNNSTIRRSTRSTRSNSSVRPRTNTRRNNNVTRPRSNSTRSSTRMSTPRRSSSSATRSSSSSTRRSSGTSSSSSRSSSTRRR
ncbi:hypothetical protein [Psychroserpens sp.]|uniref:hypothetical protein n=1 Tax=Psychroserpens sp. TaxID=2020870 RepID=UPI002B274740|nr:hypothetical protein [Psychroserpens sp.]